MQIFLALAHGAHGAKGSNFGENAFRIELIYLVCWKGRAEEPPAAPLAQSLANENVLRIPNVFIMPETCQRADILACQSSEW